MAQASAAVATLNGFHLCQVGQPLEGIGLDCLFDAARPPKDLFVSTLAHELRQPLSTMLAAVEVVRLAPGTEAARRAADVLERQLSQMSRLVEDLMDASRWAHGKVTLSRHRLDLRKVIAEAVADADGGAVARGQLLVAPGEDLPVWVDGDHQRLVQVVSNLLQNAVKYTPCGGRVAIVVERTATDVDVRVSDDGPGIEAADLPHVFELFSQMQPQEGLSLGIGLSIVREIVQGHSGSVVARSAGAGKGSEFIVRLPLARVLVQ